MGGGGFAMTALLARGSPYVTMRYDAAVPVLSSAYGLESWGPLALHDVHWDAVGGSPGDDRYSSESYSESSEAAAAAAQLQPMSVFTATYANGATWLLFFEGGGVELEELEASASPSGTPALAAAAPFTGVLRAALVPPALPAALLSIDELEHAGAAPGGRDDDDGWTRAEAATAILVAHAAAYPVGADVGWDLGLGGGSDSGGDDQKEDDDEGATASYSFTWKVARMGVDAVGDGGASSGEGEESFPLLMLALPHHVATMTSPSLAAGDNPLAYAGRLRYTTLKGSAAGVAGSSWTMAEALTTIGFTAPSGRLENAPVDMVSALLGALEEDMKGEMVPDTFVPHQMDASGVLVDPKWLDPYGFGKAVARAARLSLVADELGNTAARDTALAAVKAALEPWLAGSNTDALCYDKTWGGLISSAGTESQDADFGNGWYNDVSYYYYYYYYYYCL
jgi:hypothetical protein